MITDVRKKILKNLDEQIAYAKDLLANRTDLDKFVGVGEFHVLVPDGEGLNGSDRATKSLRLLDRMPKYDDLETCELNCIIYTKYPDGKYCTASPKTIEQYIREELSVYEELYTFMSKED